MASAWLASTRAVLAPHHGGETAGIDVEQRKYVTVTLCMFLLQLGALAAWFAGLLVHTLSRRKVGNFLHHSPHRLRLIGVLRRCNRHIIIIVIRLFANKRQKFNMKAHGTQLFLTVETDGIASPVTAAIRVGRVGHTLTRSWFCRIALLCRSNDQLNTPNLPRWLTDCIECFTFHSWHTMESSPQPISCMLELSDNVQVKTQYDSIALWFSFHLTLYKLIT